MHLGVCILHADIQYMINLLHICLCARDFSVASQASNQRKKSKDTRCELTMVTVAHYYGEQLLVSKDLRTIRDCQDNPLIP